MNFDFLDNLVPLRDEEIAERQAELDRLEKDKRFHDWQLASGIGRRYREADLAQTEYEKEALDFLDRKTGFMVLLGKAGTGKTYFACALLNRAVKGLYTTVPDIEDSLHDFVRYNDNKDHYKHNPLLVIDEVGRGKSDELYSILNARYSDGLPTVLVSNLSTSEFAQHLGTSLIDRIAEDRILIEFTGKSRRRQ